jgi:hypothetical protein
VLGVIAQFDKVGQGCAVGFRERRSGNIPSQADFGRGNAEAEANETNDRERLQTILRLAHEYGLSVLGPGCGSARLRLRLISCARARRGLSWPLPPHRASEQHPLQSRIAR